MSWDNHWDQMTSEERLEAVRLHIADLSNRVSYVIGALFERVTGLERQLQERTREEWAKKKGPRHVSRPSGDHGDDCGQVLTYRASRAGGKARKP